MQGLLFLDFQGCLEKRGFLGISAAFFTHYQSSQRKAKGDHHSTQPNNQLQNVHRISRQSDQDTFRNTFLIMGLI